MSSNFGVRLLELRRKAGLSADRLAQLLGIHRNSIVGYEQGSSSPNIAVLESLKNADFDWIYLLTSQTLNEFVGENFQWELGERIWASIESRNECRRKKLTAAQKFAIFRVVYLAELSKTRNVDDAVGQAMKVAA